MKRKQLVELANERKAQFLDELRKSGGVITIALKAINVSSVRYYKWVETDEEFKAKVEALLSELKAENTPVLIINANKSQVKKWEKEIRNSVNIPAGDLPLLRRRLSYVSDVSAVFEQWGIKAKASDCSNATLSSFCSVAKIMETALNDLDVAINSIRDREGKRKFTFDITAQPMEKKIVKL
ncbi:MAG: hypothetical protein LUC37_05350 [Prevotella sp.]|nr:hypothetical protein [Prevotella sp.]